MKKQFIQFTLLATLAFAFLGCDTDKKVENKDDMSAAVTTAPQIENTPLSFDANGSDSGKIAGLDTVYFEYDKASLSSSTKKAIAANAEWVKSHANVNIQIEGHCDARGSIEYNLSLGERRARAVKAYMTSLGISDSRVSIISYGKEKPILNGDSEESYSKNRRANFVPLAH